MTAHRPLPFLSMHTPHPSPPPQRDRPGAVPRHGPHHGRQVSASHEKTNERTKAAALHAYTFLRTFTHSPTPQTPRHDPRPNHQNRCGEEVLAADAVISAVGINGAKSIVRASPTLNKRKMFQDMMNLRWVRAFALSGFCLVLSLGRPTRGRPCVI